MAVVNREQAAAYRVVVDGTEIAPEQADGLKEVRIADYLRLPDSCTLMITYPGGEGIDRHPFKVGAALEVRIGAADELVTKTLFQGRVVTLEPEFGSGGCTLIVRAYDRSHELNRSRRARTFQNQTTSDIVSRIVGEAGLNPRCEASPFVHEFMQQDNETDWDFIWRLAERIGFEFIVDDEDAYFRRPTAEPDVELEWPLTLRSFRPRVTAVQQVGEVTLLAFDPATKRTIEATAREPEQITEIGVDRRAVVDAFNDAGLHVASEPVKSQAEADALAQGLLDRLANGYVAAEGVAAGDPRIKAGTTVRVDGVGSSFSGTYRITAAVHVLRGGGSYETHFSNAPSETILGALKAGGNGNGNGRRFSGLVLGTVTNNADPEGRARVRVSYPALSGELEGEWAPVATMAAGAERGALMLPQVGELVVVGFESDDTTRPVVLGSLYNGVDEPGDELLQGHDGSFAVRSDEKVYMESDADYEITSGGKLVIEVSGDCELSAGGGATLSSTRPFEVDGQNVTVSGKTVVEVKCGASSIKLTPGSIAISAAQVSLG